MLSDAEAIEAVRRASQRSANLVHSEMKHGLNTLAAIAATAPFVGLFGTLLGIANSFPGCSGEWSWCMAAIFERLAQSLAPTALGLFVAVPALWFYRYLSSQLEVFDVEMESASVELLNHLAIHLERRNQLRPQ